MKTFNHFIRYFAFCTIMLIVSCEKENNVSPGLSVEFEQIATYAGDDVIVNATVSDVEGLSAITLSIKDWNIEKVYELGTHTPRVFNVNHKFTVPHDAGMSFSTSLAIDIINKDGLKTHKSIPIVYAPDTSAPTITNFMSEISVDFDNASSTGSKLLTLNLTDDRILVSARVEIPEIGFDKTNLFSGKSGSYAQTITFTTEGRYHATVTVIDLTGNTTQKDFEFVVLGVEPENPISDYDKMHIINTSESPDHYVLGYYRYMKRTDAYKYTALIYAATDNYKIAFTPTRSIAGDYFGISPYVGTKLINSNGYAVPINIAKRGYYSVTINIEQKTYSITAHTPASDNPFKDKMCMVGDGLTYGSWAMSPAMTAAEDNPQRLNLNLSVSAATTDKVILCFATADWVNMWKPTGTEGAPAADPQITGWSFRTTGGNFEGYFTGPGIYPTTFDMETWWVTIKKP